MVSINFDISLNITGVLVLVVAIFEGIGCGLAYSLFTAYVLL